jgi:AcrR family transcriptional regulator
MDYHILRQQGLSIRKIAALRGVSRNAVRRALRSKSPPTGKRNRAKGVALEAYKPQIISWLTNDYDIVLESTRVADSYGLVSVNGVRYSVPAEYARRSVTLQSRPATVTFLVDGAAVAEHRNAPYGVRLVQVESHLPPRQRSSHERFAHWKRRFQIDSLAAVSI